MFEERPSQQKVVGVSRRYLFSMDTAYNLSEHKQTFVTENLNQFEAMRIGGVLATLAISKLVRAPTQIARRAFLYRAREIDGFVPGEESISVFAQRVISEYELRK